MRTSSGSNRVVQKNLPKGHYFVPQYVGPNVILECSCGEFRVVKRKEFSAEAVKAAKIHVANNNRKERPQPKYHEYVGPSYETLKVAYKRVRWNSVHDESTGGMVHGSNAHAGTPRLAKHQPTVGGLRIK